MKTVLTYSIYDPVTKRVIKVAEKNIDAPHAPQPGDKFIIGELATIAFSVRREFAVNEQETDVTFLVELTPDQNLEFQPKLKMERYLPLLKRLLEMAEFRFTYDYPLQTIPQAIPAHA